MKSLIFLLDNYVSITKELQSNIKVCVVFIYLHHFLINSKAPEKLNILIRPLLASLNNEKYTFFVEKTSLSLLNLTILFETKNSSPIPKVLKNVINSLHEAKKNENLHKISKKDDKKNENALFLYSTKAHGVNSFLSHLIDKHNDKIFEKYPSLLQTFMCEIENFERIFDQGKNMDSIVKSVDFENIRQNLKILNSLLSNSLLNPKIFSNLDSIFNKLLKLVHFFNLLEKTYIVNFDILNEEKIVLGDETHNKDIIYKKIHLKLIKIFKNFLLSLSGKIIIDRKKENNENIFQEFFVLFMEKIYLLLKDENTLIYELLSSQNSYEIKLFQIKFILEIYCNYEENFVELAPIFIIPILKSLNNKNKRVREFSFRCLGEMINSSLVQVIFTYNQYNFITLLSKGSKKIYKISINTKNRKST